MTLETVLNWALPAFSIPFCVTSPFLIWKYNLYRRDIKSNLKSTNKSCSPKLNIVNIKRNFEIKLLVSNYILILLTVELVNNICLVYSWVNINLVHFKVPVFTEDFNCTETSSDTKFGFSVSTWFYLLPLNISSTLSIIILPIVCLLLNTLKCVYLNYPYRKTMKRWIIAIILRFIIVFGLVITIQTYFLVILIKAILFTIDFILYVNYTYKFYVVLKGRKIEAHWHSTKTEFREKSRILSGFVFTTVYSMLLFFILLIGYLVSVPLFVIEEYLQTPCEMEYLTLGIFPNIDLTYSVEKLISELFIYTSTAKYIISITHQLGIFFAYFAVCIRILIVEYKRQNNLKEVNKPIHEMVMKYQNAIYSRYNRKYQN